MRRLAIFGASGHGKVVADTAECCDWNISFYDDNPAIGDAVGDWPVLGTFEDLLQQVESYDGVIVGIGNNRNRMRNIETLLSRGAPLVSIVHPAATVSKSARLEAGTVVMAGAVINADSRLGLACIVNTGATVDHDCELGDGVHVSPGANLAGLVTVGPRSWVGIGAAVRQQIVIGSDVTVAAGAAVVNDVVDGIIVAGVPAKRIR